MRRRSYSELIQMSSYEDRYRYLKLGAMVGESTFGFDRYLNQQFYTSREWRTVRRDVISRDNGCDLAHPDHSIFGKIVIHHINPLTVEDVERQTSALLDLDNLICCSYNTHQAIHFGDELVLTAGIVDRKPNDTVPWRT